MLRDYQLEAHAAVMGWVKKSLAPCLVEAATGAGKSHNIAEFAKDIHQLSGKVVLCLAPSGELVEQNYEKFLMTGNKASKFSASVGEVSLKHPVIFGTPKTVLNRINWFGGNVAAVAVDEAHEITPTIKAIIEALRAMNSQLRVVGFSATPYRLKTGFIYRLSESGSPMPEASCVEPYFLKKVYTVPARMLIDNKWLTPPVIGEINTEAYKTLHMELNSRGQFNKDDIDRAYHGHGRKTSAVVADVINQSRNRLGVMFFAATVQHAEEIIASLPPQLSAIITGKTKKQERKNIIRAFKHRKIKYLVNVGVLTRGFDADHVDVIAILRATESVALLQQIVGRGLRIREGKADCLVLDYAQNLERHCPDGDIFSPKIKAGPQKTEGGEIGVKCPECETENLFGARKNPEEFQIDDEGYFCDLEGMRIETEFGPMPAHHGRRCGGIELLKGGDYKQCSYRWTFKHCPHCDAENDIAARYCVECSGEIIDPNEKLQIEFKALKRDPCRVQTDKVIAWETSSNVSRNGNPTIRVDVKTEYRKFSVWFLPEATNANKYMQFQKFKNITNNGKQAPVTVTYKKNKETGFYQILDYNRPQDELKQN